MEHCLTLYSSENKLNNIDISYDAVLGRVWGEGLGLG